MARRAHSGMENNCTSRVCPRSVPGLSQVCPRSVLFCAYSYVLHCPPPLFSSLVHRAAREVCLRTDRGAICSRLYTITLVCERHNDHSLLLFRCSSTPAALAYARTLVSKKWNPVMAQSPGGGMCICEVHAVDVWTPVSSACTQDVPARNANLSHVHASSILIPNYVSRWSCRLGHVLLVKVKRQRPHTDQYRQSQSHPWTQSFR